MEEQLQELADDTQKKFGLADYYLKRHHIFYETNNLETTYLLSMEWFPEGHDQTDEDYNPAGTAVIDVDIHTKAVKRIVFVHEKTFATEGDYPSTADQDSVIEWVEEMTGLQFGRQFQLLLEEDGAFSFQAVVDNIPVYPSGSIEVEFNDYDQLASFFIDGSFPAEDIVKWEPFSLTPEKVDQTVRNQFKLLEVPLEAQEKWLPVYGIEELFVANDGSRTLPFEPITHQGSYVEKALIMGWDTLSNEKFYSEEIDLSSDVSEKQALANEPHLDTFPITESEQMNCEEETLHFLQRVYPDDSGKWTLTGLRRDNGAIVAELRLTYGDKRALQRKLRLIIDSERYIAINYVDNNLLFDMFKHFHSAETPAILANEAFEKIREHIEITPVYVFDNEMHGYILCGKIDCDYSVNAVNGEFVLLDEL